MWAARRQGARGLAPRACRDAPVLSHMSHAVGTPQPQGSGACSLACCGRAGADARRACLLAERLVEGHRARYRRRSSHVKFIWLTSTTKYVTTFAPLTTPSSSSFTVRAIFAVSFSAPAANCSTVCAASASGDAANAARFGGSRCSPLVGDWTSARRLDEPGGASSTTASSAAAAPSAVSSSCICATAALRPGVAAAAAASAAAAARRRRRRRDGAVGSPPLRGRRPGPARRSAASARPGGAHRAGSRACSLLADRAHCCRR